MNNSLQLRMGISITTCLALAVSAFAQTTAPAAPVKTNEELMADVQSAEQSLAVALGNQDQLANPTARAKVAVQAIPLLRRIVDDINAVAGVPDAQKARAKTRFQALMAALGDQSSIDALNALAASSDPATALQGQTCLIVSHWLSDGNDAAAQTKTVDELETLDKAHPDSNDLTQCTYDFSERAATPELKTRLVKLAVGMTSQVAGEIKQMAAAQDKLATLEGKPLVVSGTQVDGNAFSTADWKGKVVLVDFWATWCGPCRAELPNVKKAYSDYHSKGLEIIGVSNDYDAGTLKVFTASNDMPWPELFDTTAAAGHQWNPITTGYGVFGIPTMFLIDKKGVVRTTKAVENMDTMIPQLLAE